MSQRSWVGSSPAGSVRWYLPGHNSSFYTMTRPFPQNQIGKSKAGDEYE